MSPHRKYSIRDKVTGEKWINLERNTLPRAWAISEGERVPVYRVVNFYGLGNFIGK